MPAHVCLKMWDFTLHFYVLNMFKAYLPKGTVFLCISAFCPSKSAAPRGHFCVFTQMDEGIFHLSPRDVLMASTRYRWNTVVLIQHPKCHKIKGLYTPSWTMDFRILKLLPLRFWQTLIKLLQISRYHRMTRHMQVTFCNLVAEAKDSFQSKWKASCCGTSVAMACPIGWLCATSLMNAFFWASLGEKKTAAVR